MNMDFRAPHNTTQAGRLTAELFTIPLSEGKYIVYAPLRRAAFIGNAATVNCLADMQTGLVSENTPTDRAFLAFLRHLKIVDGGDEEIPSSDFSGDPAPTTVSLFLTTRCNLRCTYCYASAGDTPAKTMETSIAKRGIDEIVKNALKTGAGKIEVNYHGGGEPTVNWDTLYQSYEYAAQLCAQYDLGLVTSLASNGVMNERKVDWIVDHLDGVSISFDGLPAVHDEQRLTIAGLGSSKLVEKTMRAFDDARFAYGLRMTVTADQISLLAESVSYIFDNFEPQALQVEPAYQLDRWRDRPSAETAAFLAAFREAQINAGERGREIQFSGARLGLLSPHFCAVTQDSFCLSTESNVSACYEVFSEDQELSDRFFYGKAASAMGGYEFDLKTLGSLRGQTVDRRKYCSGCFAKWSCGGDCLNKALAVNDGREFSGTDRCHLIRELTKDQILAAIANSEQGYWLGEGCSSCSEEEEDR